MYVTNVTVLRGDRGLTEVTLYDILEAIDRSLHFKWHYTVILGFIREMFPHTGFTKMNVTKVTVLRGAGVSQRSHRMTSWRLYIGYMVRLVGSCY